ncbi:MAG TPA: ATP-dependent helicase HrpB [Acidimicrobiales bacterium]
MPVAPTGLPVEEAVDDVRAALAERRAAVLVAPPGAGKTTVVPLRLLHEPWLEGRRIVVLEPRRLAARAAARRMAFLLGDGVGDTVGYQTRDERRIGPTTRVEVVTEGILTRRLQHDPDLPGVGLVILDEVHERNLHGELALTLALDARRVLRPDLRLLAMSATLDADRLAKALGDGDGPAPVVRSEARAYPVEVRWVPRGKDERLEPPIAAVVRRSLADDGGDALVFLPGMAEIRRTADLLDGIDGVDVRPLHGSLSLAEQDAALAPSPPGRRRVVLSTDIAETSLTVEGVRIVVDSGLARAPRFDARTGMTRLRTIPITRSSADQRAGRAGRTEPGVAYRLWSTVEHTGRRAHPDAEITQVDLTDLALELALWGTPVQELTWLDPPPRRTLEEGRVLLRALGALDSDGQVTLRGRAMAELPLHPRLARMVIDADARGDGWLACLLGALVDDRDVLRGRPDDLPADIAVRVALLDGHGDHPAADRRAAATVSERARELARRADVRPGPLRVDRVGRVLALAYPDRVAIRRGTAGKFQLRTGTRAWLRDTDSLAEEPFLAVADLDGDRREARIRLAAVLDGDDVSAVLGDEVQVRRTLAWDRERAGVVARVERSLGGITLDTAVTRPDPSADVTALLVRELRAAKLSLLPWGGPLGRLRARMAFLHGVVGAPWPDVGDDALVRELDEWLGPLLHGVTALGDLDELDIARALRDRASGVAWVDLDRLAPATIKLPSGRAAPVEYRGDAVVVAARPQDFYGSDVHPTIAGVPLQLHLLSPAGRPIQITTDLPGFWRGSWADVRKDMAGRYPRHPWPADPTTASPG